MVCVTSRDSSRFLTEKYHTDKKEKAPAWGLGWACFETLFYKNMDYEPVLDSLQLAYVTQRTSSSTY